MPNKKVLVAITARPSYSRVRSALEHLRDDPTVDLWVLCSGSALLDRYGRVSSMIRADGFNVVEELYTFVEGDDLVNMALTAANTVSHTAGVLRRLKPDMVVTIADRYETLGTAVAAAYLNIPLVHIQGGELTGNIDEKVRHAVSKLADLHLVSTASSGQRLVRMGENPQAVVCTGCPSIDIARESMAIDRAAVAAALEQVAAGDRNLHDEYIVVLTHPETDFHEESFEHMAMVLDVVERTGKQAIVFWPNVDAGSDGTSKAIRVFRESGRGHDWIFAKNLEGHLFLALLRGALCLVGNSSVGVRECSYLGIPVVNIGDRQQGRERSANVTDVPWDAAAIEAAVAAQMVHGHYPSSELYGDGHAGALIAREIAQATPAAAKRFHDG